MKMTADEITRKLQKIWPDLEYIWLWDTTFWLPKLEEIDQWMSNSIVSNMDFIPEINDCDNFAKQFNAEVRRNRYWDYVAGSITRDEVNVALLDVFGIQFRGIMKKHMANLCVCQEGEYMVDMTPGERRRWKADPKNDTLLYASS